MKLMPQLSIVIPAYNEEENIETVAQDALTALKKYSPAGELLFVDDGSTDATPRLLDRLARKDKRVRVVHHPKNQGFSGAISTCYREAARELIFLAPGDGQIRLDDVGRFLEKITAADVVIGYRLMRAESPARKLNSFLFHLFYRLLFGVPVREISTAVLWRKSVLDAITITAHPRSALIEPEVIYKAWKNGARLAEVGVPYYPRRAGTAKGGNPLMILMTIRELVRLRLELMLTVK